MFTEMIPEKNIAEVLIKNQSTYHPVISFDPRRERIASLDLSKKNSAFTSYIFNDREAFNAFINQQREASKSRFLVGGYRENREMYRRSELFGKEEPRSLHLGIDVWGDAGTKVYTPLGGMVHSFKYNDNFGDYGATIIMQHQLETFNFYLLYGHLALEDIQGLREGQYFSRGQALAHFGAYSENGNWPPHLHFQLIIDITGWEGDYPGVCKLSEAQYYLQNSPDPAVFLNLKPSV